MIKSLLSITTWKYLRNTITLHINPLWARDWSWKCFDITGEQIYFKTSQLFTLCMLEIESIHWDQYTNSCDKWWNLSLLSQQPLLLFLPFCYGPSISLNCLQASSSPSPSPSYCAISTQLPPEITWKSQTLVAILKSYWW